MQVSVTIIARDAAPFLEDCLSSAVGLTDDLVVVVDDRTRDDTAVIAGRHNARVFTRRFTGFADQHNYADSQARYPWILSLDADETLSPELVSEILSLKNSPGESGFMIPRKNKIFGRFIRHSNWDPDGLLRLYSKDGGTWKGRVHEQFVTVGSVGRVRGAIFHDNYRTVEEFITRQDMYSTLDADKLDSAGIRFSLFRCLWSALYDFGRRYFWHAGFLDGWHGLYLAYLMSIYHLTIWTKLWQKQKSQNI